MSDLVSDLGSLLATLMALAWESDFGLGLGVGVGDVWAWVLDKHRPRDCMHISLNGSTMVSSTVLKFFLAGADAYYFGNARSSWRIDRVSQSASAFWSAAVFRRFLSQCALLTLKPCDGKAAPKASRNANRIDNIFRTPKLLARTKEGCRGS